MTSPVGPVLMVLPNTGNGGMQAQVQLISAALVAEGLDVAVLVGGLDVADVRDGVRYLPAPPFFQRRGWDFFRQLRRAVRELTPVVVHGHGLRTGPWVALSGSRAKRFVTCHGIDPDAVSTPLLNALRILPVTVLSCGPGPQRVLAEHGFETGLLENATPPATTSKSRSEFNARFGTTDDDFVALWPARYSDQKNHHALIEFAENLRDSPAVIVCCGDGPLQEVFATEVAQRGLSRHIRIFDFVEQAGSWLGATDFFVLPSKWEGQPLIVLEALRANVPSMTWTPVGAELLRHAAHFSGPREAALVLRQWIDNPDARRAATTGYEAEIESHGVAIAISRYTDLYYS